MIVGEGSADVGMIGGPGVRMSWPVMCHKCEEFEMVGGTWDGHTFTRDDDMCNKGMFKEAKRGPCRYFVRKCSPTARRVIG